MALEEQRASGLGAILSQLGSNLEAQEGPKSRPRHKKIDVEKQLIFSIDF